MHMKKELYRSENRIIFGICGGIAEYFEIDVTVLRLAFLLVLIFTGFFPFGLFYLFAVLVVPERRKVIEIKSEPEHKKDK